ncbi:MAG: NAD(P)-dependent oxidoreductase [Bacteroidota bacterium]
MRAPDLKGKKIFVIGANGYIGRHLVNSLIRKQADVLAADIQQFSLNPSIRYVQIDISDSTCLNEVNWDFDLVFNLAGQTGTHSGFEDYENFTITNEIGLLNLLDRIRQSAFRPRIIFPSTRLVYKGADFPLSEKDEKEAKTVYAVNKLAGEQFLNVFQNYFGINYTVYRICIPYGNTFDSTYSFGTTGNFLNQVIKNSEIILYGDGLLRRTFTHIEDICDQIILSSINKVSENETYNIIGEEFSLFEIAEMIAEKFNSKIRFVEWPEQDRLIESGHTVFNSSKLESTFNIVNNIGFKDWLTTLDSK